MNSLTHEEIENLSIFLNESSGVAFNNKNPKDFKDHRLAFAIHGVAPEFLNLVTASALMYQALTMQFNFLEKLVTLSYTQPQTPELKQMIAAIQQMQDGCMLAQRCAQLGNDEVVKTLEPRT